ncbi:myrosinase 1-like isoform X2 [Copidosoma floridanum]|uniref:myrosinase 1-like isoform X2 n=1 Tax=Copidosoma floridanum TaxID=29053 RepID=UPI0006C94A46|nr:myrosinase 1-like isoform X2 [Copidosoma floridanum]
MWFVSEVLTINALSGLFGLFLQADYSTRITLHADVEVVENNTSTRNFEFPAAAVETINALARNRFPDTFRLGAASSAYQVEGAYNRSGRGLSVWDYWTHERPSLIRDGGSGDVACDSFNKWPDDVGLVKDIEANAYRFSLSWSRILPNGLSNLVSPDGVGYYNELIDKLVLDGVAPMVTIHHFDVPHKLQLLGGWTNPRMIDYFESYARLAFAYFGDRVKLWVTINDPWELCNRQLGDPYRPIYNDSGIGNYLCGQHVLLAHARAYNMYRSEFQRLQRGKVGISLGARWFEPEDYTSPEDAEAAELSFQFANYWFLQPLLGEMGNYPEPVRLAVELRSALQGYRSSRLPALDRQQIELLKSSLDFLGLSFFTTYSVRSIATGAPPAAYDCGSAATPGESSLEADMAATWLPYEDAFGAHEVKNTAGNFGKLLKRLSDDYILPKIYITANGYPDFGESYDVDRAVYLYDHMGELLEAMKSGLDVRGYFVWSLMDSFEWQDGYR